MADKSSEEKPETCGTTALGGEPGTLEPESATKPSKQYFVRLGRPRPSQIMRRMDRVMHLRWLEKIRPAKIRREHRGQTLD